MDIQYRKLLEIFPCIHNYSSIGILPVITTNVELFCVNSNKLLQWINENNNVEIKIRFEDMKDITLNYLPLRKKQMHFVFTTSIEVDMINCFPLANFKIQVELIKAAIEKEEYIIKLDNSPEPASFFNPGQVFTKTLNTTVEPIKN